MAQTESSAGEEFSGTPRFRIVRRLGAGGMGVVYEAWDTERKAAVALKTLRSMSADRLLMFKNEFRALADLSHPNLAALYELFEHEGQWFFTMELVEGVHVLEYLRADAEDAPVSVTRTAPRDGSTAMDSQVETAPPSGWGPIESSPVPAVVDFERVRPVFGQIARGLVELHRRGKVHRDIKPSNVLVTGDGRVVILDFGLVAPAGETKPAFMGTPGYMAPEQASGAWVGPACDWYALGVVLYQALCGRLPFLGSAEDVMRAKARIAPIPPRVINPEAPASLESLCLALMRASPERRAGAVEVLEALGFTGDAPISSAAIGETPGFVGRAGELAALDRALADLARGPISVLVRGESGIGKSALVAEWTSRIVEHARDVVVLAGRCYERESVPYKALDGVMDALAARYPDTLEHLGSGHRAVLARAFPSLDVEGSSSVVRRPSSGEEGIASGSDPGSGSGPDDGRRTTVDVMEPAQVRRQLYAAVRALFADVAARARVILTIDDLQWADDDGLALLHEAVGEAAPILVVATTRPGVVHELPGQRREIELGALAADDAAELAARWAGPDAREIAAEAGGHPLFIAELARSPRAELPRGVRLEDALWRRISVAPAELRALLDVVAVAGQPLRQDLAGACAGIEAARLVAVLTALREQSLIRTTGPSPSDAVDAYHARVRDAVLAHLAADLRRVLHATLAARLEGEASIDSEAVAEHWVEAGEPARALGFWIEAAEEATLALAFDRAARLYRRALEICDDAPRAHRLRMALGQALADGGRGAEAARVFRRAADDAPPQQALELRRRAAEQLLRAGHVDEGLEGLREVLGEVGLELPRDGRAAIPRLLALRARLRLRGYRLAKPRPPDPLRHARIEVCWTAALGLSMVDAVRGAEFQTRLLLGALGDGDAYHAALGLSMEAGHLSAAGVSNASRTAAVVERARALAADTADPHAMAMATGAAAMAAYLEGRFIDALELSTQGVRLFRAHCVGATWERDTQIICQSWSRAYLGKLDELAKRVPQLVAEAQDLGDLYLATSLSTGNLVVLPLSRDDVGSARRAAAEAMRRWTHQGFLHQHWDDLLGQGEIDLYEGDAAGAHRRITDGWPSIKRAFVLMIQMSRCEAWSLRARAALAQVRAAREVAPSDARRLAHEVTAGIRALRGQAPYADALASLYAAGLAASSGDVETAARELRVAITSFDATHMSLHAAVSRHRLAALVRGNEAEELARLVRGYSRREGLADLDKMTSWLAPGF
ncbi:MAG TPA: protein kinase [Kofleriaceae bacterium]|nr:protein kinase [Kofleriaceae bacterium]